MSRPAARRVLVGAAALALAAAALGWPGAAAPPTDHVLVLDVSRSHAPDPLALLAPIERRLRALDARAGDRVAVVGFGREPVVLAAPRPAADVAAVGAAVRAALADLPRETGEGSVAASAVALALDLVRPGRPVALTLLGDGRYAESALDPALRRIRTTGGRVAAAGPLVPPAEDVALAPAGRVPGLRRGAVADVPVRVEGHVDAPRSVRIEAPGASAAVALVPGRPAVATLRVRVPPDAAAVEVRITAHGGADASPGNDRLSLPVRAEREARVAVLGPRAAAVGDLAGAGADVAFAGAATSLPADRLATFDAVVLADVAAGPGGLDAARIGALLSAVREGGAGLAVLGGPHAFGAGGYGARDVRALDGFLPLSSRPAGRRLVLVLLDRSGSMDRAGRLSRAVAAVLRLARRLGPEDLLQVLPFAARPGAPVPSAAAPPESFEGDAARSLLDLAPSGGTRVVPALEAALDLLRPPGDGERERIVVVLSDLADPALDGQAGGLRRRLEAAGAALVCVLLDPAPETVARAELLGGRLVEAPEVTPDVLVRAVSPQGFVVEDLTVGAAEGPAEGFTGRALRAWNPVRAGEGARVWLAATDGRPLGADVRRGAGRVAALATDALLEPWTRGLVAPLLRSVLPPPESATPAWWEEGELRFLHAGPEPARATAGGREIPLGERLPGTWGARPDGTPRPPVVLLEDAAGRVVARVPVPPRGDPELHGPPDGLAPGSWSAPAAAAGARVRWPFGIAALLLLAAVVASSVIFPSSRSGGPRR